jgi:IMP dehydrogenase
MIINEALAFDDVLLVPTYTEVRSRSVPKLDTEIAGIKLTLPMISSPMDTVTESKMAIAIGLAGGMGVIHRFMSSSEQIDNVRSVVRAEESHKREIPKVAAIGLGSEEVSRFKELWASVPLDAILVDVANGHSSYMAEGLGKIKDIAPDVKIIAGNVATGEGFYYLANTGMVDAVRVGIGSGAICSTRIQTGFGVPLLHSVMDCYRWKTSVNIDHRRVAIIADGGIRYPSDMVKAIAAGADAVMCGNIFAATDETPGELITDEIAPITYKTYRGMASAEVQRDHRGGLKPLTCAEGVSTRIPAKGSVVPILDEFAGGLRSGMTYANSTSLSELRLNSRFIKITHAGLLESHAFGTRKH